MLAVTKYKEIMILLLLEYGGNDYVGINGYEHFAHYIKSIELIKLAAIKGIEFKHLDGGDKISKMVNEICIQREKLRDTYKNVVEKITEDLIIEFKLRPGSINEKLANI